VRGAIYIIAIVNIIVNYYYRLIDIASPIVEVTDLGFSDHRLLYSGLVHLIGRHQFTERLLVDCGDLSTMITSPIYSVSQLFQTLNHLNSLNRLLMLISNIAEVTNIADSIAPSRTSTTCATLRPLTL